MTKLRRVQMPDGTMVDVSGDVTDSQVRKWVELQMDNTLEEDDEGPDPNEFNGEDDWNS